MFDFRYHVVSLSAVFLALVIGILVGVGISGRGLLGEAERNRLNERIATLEAESEDLEVKASEGEAGLELAGSAYPALVANRLAGKRVAVLFVGDLDGTVRRAIQEAVRDAGGTVVRLLAMTAPVPSAELRSRVSADPELGDYLGDGGMNDLGRDLGNEFVTGGETPLWEALAGALVGERGVAGDEPAHAVVVCRTALPQRGATARLLNGLYSGVARAAPAVGVEASTAAISSVPVYQRHGLSSVDAVELRIGQIALVVLLAGGAEGHYGIKDARTPAVPEIEPLPPPPIP